MTPHHLAATAAAWSLHQARGTLTARIRDNHHTTRPEPLPAAMALRSSSAYGVRHGVGSHGDPSGILAVTGVATWLPDLTALQQRVNDTLQWLAATLNVAEAGVDPLAALIAALPRFQAGTVREAQRWLSEQDRRIRDVLQLVPDRRPLPGVACPHCGQRQLVVQCAGPVDVWTVVCGTGRLCVGVGCGCGMAGAVEGAPHIWRRADVIGAVAPVAKGSR